MTEENLENIENKEDEVVCDNVDVTTVLTNRISELEEKNQELKDNYLRAHAEMENLRKRSAMEMQKKEKYAVTNFARDLLPVADSLERALATIPEDNQDELLSGFVSGMKITLDELNNTFNRYKVVKISSLGEKFNHDRHQVIQTVEDPEKEDGIIVSEWQLGYMIDDRVLRDSKVVVVKNNK